MNINYVKNENGTITITISEEQFENHLCLCEDCGRVMFINEATMLENRYYCGGCLTTCDECGRIIRREDVYLAEDSDYTYCRECFLEETIRCADCGNRYRYDDSLHEVEGNWYCDDCYEDHRPIINDYHTQKNYGDIVFYGGADRRDELHMGFELEVDSSNYVDRERIAAGVKDVLGSFAVIERDSSLLHGFEIISQPATLNYHLSMMPKYKEVCEYLIDNDMRSHDAGTCGFHVHIDAKYIGAGLKLDAAISKLLYITEKHRDSLLVYSRRTPEQAEDWCRSRRQTYSTEAGWIKKAIYENRDYRSYASRYFALNLNNLDEDGNGTLEFRFFRGSLLTETIEASLKLVERLVNVSMTVRAVDLVKMSFDDLLGDDPTIRAYWNRVSNK